MLIYPVFAVFRCAVSACFLVRCSSSRCSLFSVLRHFHNFFFNLKVFGVVFLPDVVSFLDEFKKHGAIFVDKVPLGDFILNVFYS